MVHRGHFQKNEDVDTNLLGFTLGKLLLDGDRADFWGKVSINRRLEHEYQDDFFEINAYVMAMGTGFSPWTSRHHDRIGGKRGGRGIVWCGQPHRRCPSDHHRITDRSDRTDGGPDVRGG